MPRAELIARRKWTNDTLHNFQSVRFRTTALGVSDTACNAMIGPGKSSSVADRDGAARLRLEHLQRIRLRVVARARRKKLARAAADRLHFDSGAFARRRRTRWRESNIIGNRLARGPPADPSAGGHSLKSGVSKFTVQTRGARKNAIVFPIPAQS